MTGTRQILFIQGAARARTTNGTTNWLKACGVSSETGTRSATPVCPTKTPRVTLRGARRSDVR